MMNMFYHDRINQALSVVESTLSKINYADAKASMDALKEIRSLVNTTYDLSKATEHIWNENSYVLGENWQDREAGVNPNTGERYTYVDQWAARYELIRREIVRKIDGGYSIRFLPPSNIEADVDR